jgi:rhodanese-related sulfurtransferase
VDGHAAGRGLNVTPDELDERRAGGGRLVVVDVRSRREFDEGHVPGAVHLPYWQALFATVPPGGDLVLYCGHGPRARLARALLRLRGVTGVCLLDGHYALWLRQSRQVER